MLTYSYFVFELIALGCAFYSLHGLKEGSYKYFPFYLSFIVLYEIGSLFYLFNIKGSNLWITNITMMFSFIFYAFILISQLTKVSVKRKIKIIIYVCITVSILNLIFYQGFWRLDTISILCQYALLITITCLFFYEILEISYSPGLILRLPAFWLNTGLLFFCLSQFLFFASFTYMAYRRDYQYYIFFKIISNTANGILYSCLSISFLCFGKAKRQFY